MILAQAIKEKAIIRYQLEALLFGNTLDYAIKPSPMNIWSLFSNSLKVPIKTSRSKPLRLALKIIRKICVKDLKLIISTIVCTIYKVITKRMFKTNINHSIRLIFRCRTPIFWRILRKIRKVTIKVKESLSLTVKMQMKLLIKQVRGRSTT